ncbi:putative F-box domain, galactose oxidase/kelch, beta-propeller, galactose oxidase, beta-propeller [Rosa chinensis]|uniref:Putative F-box domain, galactose oxidase/kelch, beta-propeller, galactose oxidase, beta-propeller n=1 Tax=Rosa chinensis TaxID=74649 RepID=A0A2P6PZL1_ROSCH|nr:F-box only protein 13 [Rosa chinensis]XP_040363849.1 F-box only protein 13 [Rosa chinensis]PRQ27380.1 putative F-box domain, galactose oxidase/kelch, beta-propeller, galactose oxidase, beta-propeller [Rosa chinensis]
MEQENCSAFMMTRKRKSQEENCISSTFLMDELNEDLLEGVLSRLPISAFFRLSSVCKRWKSVANSSSFKLACSQIPSRDPWFFMVDSHLNRSIVFDSAEKNWKKLNHPPLLQTNSNCNSMPVSASGGFICFRNSYGNFVVCNPVTGSCNEQPPLYPALQSLTFHAIVMSSCPNKHDQSSYRLVVVFGELPKLSFRVYNSSSGCWEEEITLCKKFNDDDNSKELDDSTDFDSNDDSAVYFLSKAGNVVATNMQRSPSKQYSSVITNKDGEEIVHFLSSSGSIVACNLTSKCFIEYPRLLPVFYEYSIDLVECGGRMLVVLLSEFFESASLRVWCYDEDVRSWQQIAAMPPAMSHEWYGKNVDINCVGAGDQILICLSSAEISSCVMCDLAANEWVELPKCYVDGEAIKFMSAFSFQPRIEASL